MAPRRVVATTYPDNFNTDWSSPSSVDATGPLLPFTEAHNRLIESQNSLPPGALNRAYRQAFGSQVNGVIRNLVEPKRPIPIATSGRGFRCGYGLRWDERTSQYYRKGSLPKRATTSANKATTSAKKTTTSAKKPTTSAERLAQFNNSAIRRSPRNALKAQQQNRRPAPPVQRGGTPSSTSRRLRPRARVVSLAESFQLAAAAASRRAGRHSAVLGRNAPEYRHATVEEVSDDEGEVERENVPSATFGASSTRPGVPAEFLRRPGALMKERTETGSVAPTKYKTSKFAEDLNYILPSRPVSVQKSPLFGNTPPRSETITTKRRNWVGGLFASGNKAPAAAPSTPNGKGGGGLFGSTPATPAPITPPGTGVFGKRLSSTSVDSHFGSGEGLGGLDEETIEAIRLARRAAAARGERNGPSPMSRGRYGLSCFTPSSSSKKKNHQQSARPLPSPEFAPRYAGYNNNNNRKPTFGGHAEIHGVNCSTLKRSNAIRDPYRNTGAQGVAGVSGVHRVPRVETRRAGTGRPRYFAPNPDLRLQGRGGRQVPGSGQWLAGGYGRGRW